MGRRLPDRGDGSGVRQIAVPQAVRARSTLAGADYEDAHVADTRHAQDRTAEEWARAAFEGAPAQTRALLRSGWLALGIDLAHGEPGRVFGWEVRRAGEGFVLLGADARFGLTGEVQFERRRRSLLVATFVQLSNPFARALWTAFIPGHRRAVRHVLGSVVARANDELR